MCLVNVCSFEADRVKQIKTDAKVNQVQTSKLIASLIAEKEKLLRDLDAVNRSGTPADGLTYDGDYLFYSKLKLKLVYCLEAGLKNSSKS